MQEYKFPDEKGEKGEKVEAPEFELELEGDETPEIEIVDDTPEKDRGRKPLDKEIEEPTEDELNDYSAKVQKRLKELTHARHDERRKAESLFREKAELERVARAIADENRRLHEYVNMGQSAYIDKSKSLAELNMNAAKSKLKAALDAGDTDAVISAQDELYRAQNELTQVNTFRPTSLQKQENREYTTPVAQPQSPQLDDKVVNWAEKNPWFEKPGHEDMTGFAYGIHNKLVREFGEAYTKSDEYYFKIDEAMKRAFPDQFEAEPAPEQNRRTKSVVAPAQRTSAPKKIRLTVTQQNVAKKLGVPLELYAKKMAELENSNG
jgi:hypothetical protein